MRARRSIAGWVVALGLAGACKQPEPATGNAVQREMRLLAAAMRDSVTAIADGDVRGLPARLQAVQAAAEETEAAIERGSYKLPRNADRMAGFAELDEAFHRDLSAMATAAGQNDVGATATQLGVLVSRCHGCHAEFRPPPRP